MADDKLKTGPEPPGPDRPGDAPVKEAPPIQEPPVQETNAPGKTQEPAAPGTGPALQAEQSVIPGMGEDNPARSALGEVVVDFDKINELMSQQRAATHGAVDKLKAPATDKDGKETPIPEEKAPEADQPKKRRGRPPKEQAAVSAGKKEKAAKPRTGRPSKVDKAAREEAPPAVRDKVSRGDKDGLTPAQRGGKTRKERNQNVRDFLDGKRTSPFPSGKPLVKEAAAPPPEINLPPTPDVPPRPVEEGKIVYLKMAELHPFHTFREHPYKVQDDTMWALGIVIFVLVYGRMLEIYLLTSLAPIPMATISHREVGQIGQNYLRSLFAVGFQGLLILVCVAIYAVLIQGIATGGDPIGAIWGTVGYTVLLCFMLFKTGTIARSIFNAH